MKEVLVLYYSHTGAVRDMAQFIARGVEQVDGAAARLRTVPRVSAVCEATEPQVPATGAPYVEAKDQAERNRNTSKLLTYLDPTIDFSVGDLFGVRSLKNTFVGIGASHRSGIFGFSQLMNNVNGGSNYIYTYIEFAI